MSSESGNIKVVVRCRPMNSRERNRGASNLVEFVDNQQLVLTPTLEGDASKSSSSRKKASMPFSFDRAYDENTEQSTLFDYVGVELLQHAFNGFNTCVFAYGQTGSGKSHSMVGYAEAKGLIPLTCSQLFVDLQSKMAADPDLTISVEVSYIEIYNEKVRDLLNPKTKGNLKVREHPSLGPYVEDLSKLVVGSFRDIENLMDEGNKARTVAATSMNETSSRSHAVFTLLLTQRKYDATTKLHAEKVSRISLVDLAGSERANSTGATGARLKEGANINRSLTTLGKVIAALAAASSAESGAKSKKGNLDNFIPYRDSVLTWLLKDSLGGNSKTAMIAAISPADYEETLSTLRYADQAKKIKNKAVVNEDPNARLIRELKEELQVLRSRVPGGGDSESSWDPSIPPEKQMVRYQTKTGEIRTVTKAALQEQLEQSEKIMSSLNESWEEKLARTQEIQKQREQALEELGISVDKTNVGVHTPKKLPHLVNLNEDPLMSECLIYQIKAGQTLVGNLDAGSDVHIKLSGTKILPHHCLFEHQNGIVTVKAMPNSMTMVNGHRLSPDEPKRLRSGYRVILGDIHVFRFNHPEEVRKARDRVRSTLAISTGQWDNETLLEGDAPVTRPDSPASGDVDWTYARREYALAKLNGQNVNFDSLNEEDLEKLFEDISRARTKKTLNGMTRSESRASAYDDNVSESASSIVRPYSVGGMTDDTSVDPWSQGGSEWNYPRIPGSPSKEAMPRGETESLRAKVKEYEEKLTRMATNSPNLGDPTQVGEYTVAQKDLLRTALVRWRRHTTVSMAEDALSKAVLVKEANVISKELDKGVTYQFTIVDDFPLAVPTSGVEAIAGLTEFDDVADPELAASAKPCMGIKVLDYVHKTCYVWSVPKFEQRLQKMRNLYTFIDKPEYSQHFNWADPFYESPTPSFAFVGCALVPLNPLSRQSSSKYSLPIHDRHTGERIGTCSVQLKFVSLAPVVARTSSSLTAASLISHASNGKQTSLPVGQKFGLQIVVDGVTGLSAEFFESIHLQVKLSSFAGNAIGKDEFYTSVPIDLALESSQAEIRLRRTVSFVLTRESIDWLRSGFAPIELYAKMRAAYLVSLEEHDNLRESTTGARSRSFRPLHTIDGDDNMVSTRLLKHLSQGTTTVKVRLPEKEMVTEERHHVLASVQICELDATGDYQPVLVKSQTALDPGTFFVRQGLQRKLVLHLTHDSGRQFKWSKVTKLELSNVRLLDARGRIHGSKASDAIQLKAPAKQQTVEFLNNGTSAMDVWAWWDSSVHDSPYLNRTTVSSHRVLVQLDFEVQVEGCVNPVAFCMDLAVTVNARDARPPGRLMTLFESATTGSRTLTKTNAIFSIRLLPPLTKNTAELWRLDTAKQYVRGQETLKGWKARGISLVHDHQKLVQAERKRLEVEAVRALLRSRPPLASSHVDATELVQNVLVLWRKAVRDSKMRVVIAEQPDGITDLETSGSMLKNLYTASSTTNTKPVQPDASEEAPPKLTAEVTMVARSDTSAKRGWLEMPVETFTDSWTRRYFSLRRPFLLVYESNAEVDEIMAIHVASVRVEHDQNLERLLDRHHVFGVYTSSNSYFLQAATEKEMHSWMQALDSLYAPLPDDEQP